MSNTAATAADSLTMMLSIARISDRHLAEMTGWSRQTVHNKRTARSPLDLNDIDLLARTLGVSVTTFLMDRDQLLRWIADNAWQGLEGDDVRSRCSADGAQPHLPGFDGGVWMGTAPLAPMAPPMPTRAPSRGDPLRCAA